MGVEAEKRCRDCHTRTTPMWRAGPDGPRSLCNACGLRFRKRRKGVQGLDGVGAQKRPKSRSLERQGSSGRQFKLKEEEEAAVLLMALSCASLH